MRPHAQDDNHDRYYFPSAVDNPNNRDCASSSFTVSPLSSSRGSVRYTVARDILRPPVARSHP